MYELPAWPDKPEMKLAENHENVFKIKICKAHAISTALPHASLPGLPSTAQNTNPD
jgi:hypothetical protein